MKVIGLFLVALIACSVVVEAKKARISVKNLKPKKPLITKFHSDPALCPTCVNFMEETIDILLNVILNGGVLGSCEDLCGYLPEQWEFDFCELACSAVGIEAFIDLIDDADPDPIFYCMELDICPILDNATGVITSTQVQPPSGPAGTTFNIIAIYRVTHEIGTGEIAGLVSPPPPDFPFGGGELLILETDGTYGIKFEIDSTPSESESFQPGVYNYTIALCEGSCGSSHAHSFILDEKNGQFTITG